MGWSEFETIRFPSFDCEMCFTNCHRLSGLPHGHKTFVIISRINNHFSAPLNAYALADKFEG